MILKPGSRPVPNHPGYELVCKIGRGAFGEVWRSRAPGGIDVALKFIAFNSSAHAATEFRSVDVMRSARHPNLVSLFGAWYEDGYLILAMELCDRSLQDRLAQAHSQREPGIPTDELLGYMRDTANGLDALVSLGIHHRDVKPANLLLLGSGVKVGDFGLAKVREHSAGNTVAGTLAYIAPECYDGDLADQSDQYSLAVAYHYLRTGFPLYEGHEAAVMRAKLMAEPDLSRLPVFERSALARALLKDPSKRWPSCKAFVDELTVANTYQQILEEDDCDSFDSDENDPSPEYPLLPCQDVKVVDTCPECNAQMLLHKSRFGPGYYLGCSKYPRCKSLAKVSAELQSQIDAVANREVIRREVEQQERLREERKQEEERQLEAAGRQEDERRQQEQERQKSKVRGIEQKHNEGGLSKIESRLIVLWFGLAVLACSIILYYFGFSRNRDRNGEESLAFRDEGLWSAFLPTLLPWFIVASTLTWIRESQLAGRTGQLAERLVTQANERERLKEHRTKWWRIFFAMELFGAIALISACLFDSEALGALGAIGAVIGLFCIPENALDWWIDRLHERVFGRRN